MSNMNNQAVFFTSLKGGAGKTTLSISLCMSEALRIAKNQNNIFDEIYYFDIDLYGSGSEFILDITEKKYINTCENIDKITQYYHPINITFEEAPDKYEIKFQSTIIDPTLRIKKTYFGDTLNEHIDTSILDNILMDKLVQLLKKYHSDKKNGQLFVFDCSPGFDSFTQGLITKVKEIGIKTSILLASTYDMSHIQKLESFFQNYMSTVSMPDSDFRIILVDVLNMQNLNKVYYDNYTELVKEQLKSKTKIDSILQKNYDSRLIVANSYLRRVKIGNNKFTDVYILDSDLENQILI